MNLLGHSFSGNPDKSEKPHTVIECALILVLDNAES